MAADQRGAATRLEAGARARTGGLGRLPARPVPSGAASRPGSSSPRSATCCSSWASSFPACWPSWQPTSRTSRPSCRRPAVPPGRAPCPSSPGARSSWPGSGPSLGPMALPVSVYVAVICTMMWRAAASVGSTGRPTTAEWLALAGAVLFAASDTLIAVDRFRAPIEGVRWPIMLLYWAGQWGLAAAARLRQGPGPCGILPAGETRMTTSAFPRRHRRRRRDHSRPLPRAEAASRAACPSPTSTAPAARRCRASSPTR